MARVCFGVRRVFVFALGVVSARGGGRFICFSVMLLSRES
jgi:hypothetical protein